MGLLTDSRISFVQCQIAFVAFCEEIGQPYTIKKDRFQNPDAWYLDHSREYGGIWIEMVSAENTCNVIKPFSQWYRMKPKDFYNHIQQMQSLCYKLKEQGKLYAVKVQTPSV